MIEVTENASILPAVAATHMSFVTMEGRRFLCNKTIMKRSSLLVQQLLEAVDGDDDTGSEEILELPLPAVDAEALDAVYIFATKYYSYGNVPGGVGAGTAGAKGPAASPSASGPIFKEIEKPLRSDLATIVDPWDWSYISQTLLKGRPDGTNGTTLLFTTLNASNFLNIPPLRELCSAAIANLLRGKTDDEILALFGVASFTRADEEDICRDYPWLREPEV